MSLLIKNNKLLKIVTNGSVIICSYPNLLEMQDKKTTSFFHVHPHLPIQIFIVDFYCTQYQIVYLFIMYTDSKNYYFL